MGCVVVIKTRNYVNKIIRSDKQRENAAACAAALRHANHENKNVASIGRSVTVGDIRWNGGPPKKRQQSIAGQWQSALPVAVPSPPAASPAAVPPSTHLTHCPASLRSPCKRHLALSSTSSLLHITRDNDKGAHRLHHPPPHRDIAPPGPVPAIQYRRHRRRFLRPAARKLPSRVA